MRRIVRWGRHSSRRRLIALVLMAAVASHAMRPAGTSALARGDDLCPEPNDTFQAACYLANSRLIDQGSYISHPGDLDFYRFEVLDFGKTYYVSLFEAPAEYRVSVADWHGRVLASSDDGHLQVSIPMPGSYYLVVESSDGRFSDTEPYKFREYSGQGQSGDTTPRPILTSHSLDDSVRTQRSEETEEARYSRDVGGYTIDMKVGGGPRSPRSAGAFLSDAGVLVTADDFTYTIDTRVVRPSDELGFVIQLFFRMVDPGNEHSLVIDPHGGRARLLQRADGVQRVLSDWVTSDQIDTAGAWNRFTIRAEGPDLRVYANGTRVIHVANGTPGVGRFYLGLQAAGAPPMVRFDNALITTPGRAP